MIPIDSLLKVATVLVAVIFTGISFHAPLTVFSETHFGVSDIVKAWKELLMLPVVTILIYVVSKRQLWDELLKDWVVRLSLVYLGWHVLIMIIFPTPVIQMQAGLLIDARYVAFFLTVYVLLRLVKKEVGQLFLKVACVGAAIVVLFGTLQATVLPHDILSSLGYGDDTIQPYLTVDKNHDYIRISSTLRGPNPLGVYAASFFLLLLAFLAMRYKKSSTSQKVLVVAGMTASLTCLWFSYSRSALLMGLLGSAIVGSVFLARYVSKRVLVCGAIGLALILLGALYVVKDNHTIQQVVFHNNPADTNPINSDHQHELSLQVASEQILASPFGYGIGTTGSASLYGDKPFIIESQYLFIAHEVGVIGLLLFVALFFYLLYLLWRKHVQPLALGLFAAGVGIALVGIVQPVLVDDTVSIMWWGLAAIALAPHTTIKAKKYDKKTA